MMKKHVLKIIIKGNTYSAIGTISFASISFFHVLTKYVIVLVFSLASQFLDLCYLYHSCQYLYSFLDKIHIEFSFIVLATGLTSYRKSINSVGGDL